MKEHEGIARGRAALSSLHISQMMSCNEASFKENCVCRQHGSFPHCFSVAIPMFPVIRKQKRDHSACNTTVHLSFLWFLHPLPDLDVHWRKWREWKGVLAMRDWGGAKKLTREM